MGTLAAQPRAINLRDTRERFADLLEPAPAIYWADLLASVATGWTAFGLALGRPFWSPGHLGLCAIATLALYRSAMFIHELTHLPKGALRGFQWTWDLLAGIPLQLPSFLYLGVHLDHHRRTIYGTPADPEYQPFATSPRRRIVRYLLEAPAIPVVLLARFALLAPLSVLLGPRFRKLVVEGASSLAINWSYRREPPGEALRKRWLVCETLAAAIGISVIVLTLAGVLPPRVLGQWYLVSASMAVLNQLRTIGAHRWRNPGGEMEVGSQFLDSVNTPGPVAAIWAPVGLRFHALHHFVPDLPYHALGKAHRRLMRALPEDARYESTLSRGMWESLRTVWNEAGKR